MKRLATLVLAAGFTVSSLVGMGREASATPFSDVPANHWAYQAIQSLAADGLVEGYPDGKFKGDRPLSRYEMAVLVARVIAKLQANGAGYASKADLDKLQKLIDALKDELDSLGVRVTNLEDALDALDKRTKFAQSIQFHGAILDNNSSRQRVTQERTVNPAALTTPDAFTDVFMRSPDNNSALEQAGAGNLIRLDDRLNFSYAVNENLTVSVPIHLLNYNYGGEFSNQQGISIQPDVVINIAKAGAITNLYLRDGQLDNLKSSRLGLAYRAPDASQQGPGYEGPVQPYQKGFEIGGILNGLTEFQFSFSRLDQTLLNTQTGVAEDNGIYSTNNYLFYETRPQTGYYQAGAPGATGGSLRSDTFQAGQAVLNTVYLRAKAQIGTVYISGYNGATFNNAGTNTGGTAGVAAPGFYYLDNYNSVVFTTPIPAGSTVTISYVGLSYSNNNAYQRYEVNGRLNQKIKGLPGAEIGLSFNRIWDDDETYVYGAQGTSPAGTVIQTSVNGGDPTGVVSDTVFGADFQVPLPFLTTGDPTQHPVIFGEAAATKYTPDYHNQAAVTDTGGVIGLRLQVYRTTASVQFQSVGAQFTPGTPFQYFGNAPVTFVNWKEPFFPGFFGFANNLGINQTFDQSINQTIAGRSATTTNQALTFIYPVFNPFVASGPGWFSAYAPNTQGESFNLNSPIKLGDLTLTTTIVAQHLQEINPNANNSTYFGTVYATNKRETFDKIQGGAQVNVPVFGQSVSVNVSGAVEHLKRDDKTAVSGYVPYNISTASTDPTSAANVAAVGGNSTVLYYPNYVDEYHTTLAAAASLPVTANLVAGASYNTQQFHGAFGTTLNQNIAQRKDIYNLTLTYNVPKTTSSVGFLFRNQKYTDYVLPSYNFSQNREDVNFTVRF